MKSKCRGRAIIVNMATFSGDASNKTGSEVDSNNLSTLFNDLDFDVHNWKNLTEKVSWKPMSIVRLIKKG